MGEGPLVEVRALTKRYPSPAVTALADLSLWVPPGEVLAVIGPNGAGKTSLLRVLAGLLLPTDGSARVCGLDVARDRPRSRLCVGLTLSEDRGLSPRLTVRQNLAFFAALYRVPRKAFGERLAQLSERLEAANLLDRPVRTLSSGEKARAVLIRALLHRPRVLLLDEPTRALDPGAAARLRGQILAEVRRSDGAALWASHDLAEVEQVASRVLLLERGRVAGLGPFAEVQRASDAVFALGVDEEGRH